MNIDSKFKVGLSSGVLLVGLWGLPSLGCIPARPVNHPPIQGKSTMLVGKWQKVTTTPCSHNYPDHLEFSDRGLYTGRQTSPQQTFTWWDVGTYEVDANQVKIAIATDEIKPYSFSLQDPLLTFVDADNCEFQYRRVE